MAEFPALPLWTDAYLGDTTHLTTIEHGAYLLLLMAMWRNDGWLQNDDKLLARYARLGPGQWKRVRPILMPFFQTDGVKLFQSRLTDELSFVKQHSKKQSNAAKARWLKNKDTYNAAASPRHCHGNAPTTHPHTSEKESPNGDSKKSIDDPVFENEFWPNHPRQRRGNKQQAWRAWKRAVERASRAEIMVGHRAYCQSDEVRRGYAKGAAAWLNDDRWKHDYRTFRTKTTEELREEFIHGDQGDDLGHGVLDGECVEVPGDGSQADGGGVLPSPARLERRGDNGRGNGSIVDLDKDGTAEAGRHQDAGGRVQDLIARAAAATKAPSKP